MNPAAVTAKSDSQDASVALADYAAGLTFERLPSDLVNLLKQTVLDTLGTALAANSLGTAIDKLVDAADPSVGAPESTILGFGRKTSVIMAAMVNGAMAHALNYDDMVGTGGHVGASTVPVALALAERQGGVGGKELLAAVAAGAEVICRIGAAVMGTTEGSRLTKAPHSLRVQQWAYFGAAATAGRTLRLSASQLHSALGLALMQATGNWQPLLEGCPAKIYVGFATLGGTLSAILADRGIELGCSALEGEAGLFASQYGGNYVRSSLVDGLGRDFYALDLRFKPWPVTGTAHPFIQAALELRDEHRIDRSEDIARVTIRGGPRLRHHCEPLAERRQPQSAAAAADSIFFAVAKALANGHVCLADFSDEGLLQHEALELAQRIGYDTEPDLGDAGVVDLEMIAGGRLQRRVDAAPGHPSKPLTYEQVVDKFRDCTQYARRPLSPENVDMLIEQVDHLEQIDDVRVLALLASGGK